MSDDETRRELARAAKTVQTVNLVTYAGAIIGLVVAGGLWFWLMYEPMRDSVLAWFFGGLLVALIGMIAGSRIALTLLAR